MTHFWIPKLTLVENRDPLPCPGSGASGLFKIDAILPDGRIRPVAGWQPNLITNIGLDQIGVGSTLDYCSVGSGNTPPTVDDTALVSYIATHSSIRSNDRGTMSTSPYYGWRRKVFRFDASGADRNLSEFGVGWASGGGSLWSRALIKNQAGTPITVAWMGYETLEVAYEMRWYPSLVDVPYEMVIAGNTHTGVVRGCAINYEVGNSESFANAFSSDQSGQVGYSGDLVLATGAIGTYLQYPSGEGGSKNASYTAPYSSGSYKRTGYHVFGPTEGNVGAVTAMRKNSLVCRYQMSVSPAFQKAADWTLTINCETPTWGRYTPP